MSRVITRLLVAGVLAATVLAATSSSAGPGYHQPKVGSCHDLTRTQAWARWAPTAAVDCDKRHTTKTLAIIRMRRDVDWASDQVWFPGVPTCARKLRQALGGNDRKAALSAYGLFQFIPTPKERARGATWKRCEVGLYGGRSMRPLPEKLALGALPLPDRLARCFSGPERHLVLTVCSKPHSYRATGAFRVSGKKFPGTKQLVRKAIQRCPAHVTTRTWRYELQTGPQFWHGGWRSIVCYSKTKK